MSKSNLVSEAWCNLIFEGRNKGYGAYCIRKNIGKRYTLALLGVFSLLAAILLISWSIRLFVAREYQGALEDLQQVIPQLKMAEVKEGHEMKVIAGGRTVRRASLKAEGNARIPVLVEETKNNIRFGSSVEDSLALLTDVEEVLSGIEELDSVYENKRKDLPIEGPKLQATEVVQQMPQFPGGIKALMQWLDTNISYPQSCVKLKIGGQMQVSFFVAIDGSVHDIKVDYSLHPDIDRTVIQALKRMPRWQPGMQDGQLTEVCVTIPIEFNPRR